MNENVGSNRISLGVFLCVKECVHLKVPLICGLFIHLCIEFQKYTIKLYIKQISFTGKAHIQIRLRMYIHATVITTR